MDKYSKKEKEWLCKRWDRNLINRLVFALNSGKVITALLQQIPQDDSISADRKMVDLRGVDFSHQNLRGPWKTKDEKRYRAGISLENADFSCANLSWAIVPHANLKRAVFYEADLSNAELIYSDLSYTDFKNAAMEGAWFLDTKLYESNITEKQLSKRRNIEQMDFYYHAYEK